MTLPWVEDGMTVDEQEAVIQLLYIAQDRRMVLWELVHKPWIRDDLSATENQAIFLLASIVSVDEESAEHIVGCPSSTPSNGTTCRYCKRWKLSIKRVYVGFYPIQA